MRKIDGFLLIVIAYTFLVAVSVGSSILLIELLFFKQSGIKYDCTTASFNPDAANREICRK